MALAEVQPDYDHVNVFLTSDSHLSHMKIAEYTGFHRPRDVDQMNQLLIDNWNSVVSPNDYVYHLGDVALGKISESLPLCKELNGNKILVPGNHDRCWQGHPEKKRKGWREKYEEVGFQIQTPGIFTTLGSGKIRIYMNHFPHSGDSGGYDRYSEWRPKPCGPNEWLLHGHTHSKEQVNYDTHEIHVGVDAWNLYPVNFKVIKEIILNA